MHRLMECEISSYLKWFWGIRRSKYWILPWDIHFAHNWGITLEKEGYDVVLFVRKISHMFFKHKVKELLNNITTQNTITQLFFDSPCYCIPMLRDGLTKNVYFRVLRLSNETCSKV